MIRNQLKTAFCLRKSFADNRMRHVQFEEGDKVCLKILPMKGVVLFVKKGKLSSRNVGSYVIFRRVAKVAYEF